LSDFEEESSSIIVELARIKVIEGASLEEYSIKQEKVVIGRTENNDIMIPNSTISRNHCEISKTESGFKIKDLNSGNGIKVNNKKVSSKTLNSGDIILIGKVKLQFIDLSVEHGGATESTGSVILKVRKPPKKKIIIIAASAVVFLLIVFIAFASYSKKKRLKREREEQIAREYKKKESLKKQVNLFYEQGIGAYKNKEWNSAITYFDRVLKLKPDHSSALDYKKFATSEKENKKLVDDSEDLLLKDDYQAALLKLKKVKETSSYYADSQDRIKIANKKYKEYRFDLAKKSVKDEDYQKALSLLNALLQNYPDFDEATKLKEEVDEKLLTANKKEETPKIVKNTTFDANKYKTKKVRTNPYTKGLNMYGNKQFDQAIKFFQTLSAKDAKTYAKNVQSFKVAYANGVKYLKLKNPSKGISEFNKALSLDGKLGKKMVSDINPKLSILYAIKAKIYFGSKEYAKSYKAAKKATTLSKSDEASNVLTKLEKKARDLYLSAYQKERRSPDSSKRDYSLIMSILPQSNSIHQKAKKRLEKLK
jgi:pSer/pThr/pTyr-binding forkhead associated (FHA) protein